MAKALRTIAIVAGAVALIGWPATIMLAAATLWTFGSSAASSEKRTSADENGAPSDQVRFGRR